MSSRVLVLGRPLCVLALLLITGCMGSAPNDTRTGPLRSADAGGLSLGEWPPSHHRGPWSLTFGASALCINDPDAQVSVTGVRYDATTEPLVVEPWVRRIPPIEDRSIQPRSVSRWSPFISRKGSPPFGERLGGEVSPEFPVRISQPCAEATTADNGAVDLLTVMKVDGTGGLIRRTHIDYEADGTEHTLTINHRVGICGTALPARLGCGEPPRLN